MEILLRMNTTLSYSAVSKYLSCPYEYFLYYIEKLRPTALHSSLYFGKSVDSALTLLLTTRDIGKAKKHFNDIFLLDETISYVPEDIDNDLLTQEEYESHPEYYSLKKKGIVLIDSFNEEIMPRIKKVISTQETVILESDSGDRFKAISDLICEWEDGSTILFDIKTSIMPYEDDSVKKSIQLALYDNIFKNKYNVEKIGFLVLRKILKKNRTKVCQECGYVGTGGRHATCPNKRNNGRCDGQWNETVRPEAYIQILIDDPNVLLEKNILETVDKVNVNIKEGDFYKNLTHCKRGKNRYCDYYKVCYENSEAGLVKK